jgi:transmembrane sensor
VKDQSHIKILPGLSAVPDPPVVAEEEREGTSSDGEQTLTDQATAWVMLLLSSNATTEDVEALQRWRQQSPAHAQAFAEAKLLWEALGPAASDVARRMDHSGNLSAARGSMRTSAGHIGRRALIGGALAASVAAAGYLGSRPPFRLWPSIEEMRASYRTGTGEQRQLALSDDVSLILNTQTSVGIRPASEGARGMELIAGEAAITTKGAGPFVVLAADGRATSTFARFDMRRDGATVRVTCLDGTVDVDRDGRSVTVPAGHRVMYGAHGLQEVAPVDLSVATAWQHGQLVFRHESLARVIEEVNRYRPGRIVLLNERLAERDVVATFHLSRIDDAVEHLARAFGARVRALPGGIVLLS